MTGKIWIAASLAFATENSEMIGSKSLSCEQHPLPYAESLEFRALEDIDLLVIHCTELPDLATAREYGEMVHYEASGTGNCGHLYLDRDGHCEQWAPLERVAHHVRDYNHRSVGIELVNQGRYPDWFDSRRQDDHERYPGSQIVALLDLIEALSTVLPNLSQIAGHEDLDREQVTASDDDTLTVPRKRDPGPGFPWSRVLQQSTLTRFSPG